jgi:hypothetical protein
MPLHSAVLLFWCEFFVFISYRRKRSLADFTAAVVELLVLVLPPLLLLVLALLWCARVG